MSWFRELLVTPECLGCQKLGMQLCRECVAEINPFAVQMKSGLAVKCATEYEGWIRNRLIEYKNGAAYLARPLAEILSPHISTNACLVPIPASKAKIHERGFDTIGLLCKQLTRISPRRMVLSALHLTRSVQDQVGLSETARRKNLAFAFTARKPILHEVVLIDDVLTTGATLNEAQRALVIAGASKVSAAVLCGSPKKRYG